jgi:hypothetical protein
VIFSLVEILNANNRFWDNLQNETFINGPTYNPKLHHMTQLLEETRRLKEVVPLLRESEDTAEMILYDEAVELEALLDSFLEIVTPATIALASAVELTVGADYLPTNTKVPLAYFYDVLERKLTPQEGVTIIQEILEARIAADETDPMIDAVLTELAVIELQLALDAP